MDKPNPREILLAPRMDKCTCVKESGECALRYCVCADEVDEDIAALRSAGYATVPRKPTEAMVIAAAKAFHTSSVGDGFEPVITAAIEAGEQGGEDG